MRRQVWVHVVVEVGPPELAHALADLFRFTWQLLTSVQLVWDACGGRTWAARTDRPPVRVGETRLQARFCQDPYGGRDWAARTGAICRPACGMWRSCLWGLSMRQHKTLCIRYSCNQSCSFPVSPAPAAPVQPGRARQDFHSLGQNGSHPPGGLQAGLLRREVGGQLPLQPLRLCTPRAAHLSFGMKCLLVRPSIASFRFRSSTSACHQQH